MAVRTAYIALGSNLGDRYQQLTRAVSLLRDQLDIQRVSQFYETAPLNPPDDPDRVQPDFLNAVISAQTSLEAEDLLTLLLTIETHMGRSRSPGTRWGPRSIDIDLLALDQVVHSSPLLTLPHPSLHLRDFVLVPFAEIAPDFLHPLYQRTIRDLLSSLRDSSTRLYVR
jgi:2-amino-4-hydroxy-6-hydroxymethyldihydropteridine diphosphokinase